MSLFDAPAANPGALSLGGPGQPAQNGAPNAFGGGSNNQHQPGTSLFGAAPASAQPGGQGASLFSAAPAASTGTVGLFGNTAAPAQGGTNIFGAAGNNANQARPAGLFGSSPAVGTTGTGMFGGAPVSQQQQPQQQQPSIGGGLFGSTTQQPASGGLFGAASTAQPAAGGGLFGATGASQPGMGGGLFGNSSATQPGAGGGLFGSTSGTQQQTGATGNLFGSTSGGGSGGLFGSNTAATGGLFGQTSTNQPAQASGSMFGQAAPSQANTSLFGGLGASFGPGVLGNSLLGSSTLGLSALGPPPSSGGLFASRGTIIPPPGQAMDPHAQFSVLQQRLEAIVQAWNSGSPNCAFQSHFYNLVDPAHVHLYGRPPNATNDALWQKAVRENPDPSCLVPVIANGFDDLQQRVEAQTQTSAAHQRKLEELKARVVALAERHKLSNVSRLHKAGVAQAQIQHRLLCFIQHLHLLLPALRSSAIRPEEEALRGALDSLAEEIRGRSGAAGVASGRLRAKLNELWALVGAVNAARERERGVDGSKDGGRWAVVDDEGLKEIVQILAHQQAGLSHLTNILQKDLRDLSIVEGTETRDDTGRIRSGSPSPFASTLRSSMLR